MHIYMNIYIYTEHNNSRVCHKSDIYEYIYLVYRAYLRPQKVDLVPQGESDR